MRSSAHSLPAAIAGLPFVVFAATASANVESPDVARGRARFAAGDFRGAITDFDRALGGMATGPVTARIQLSRAQCFVALSDQASAESAFRLALQQDPEARLDPVEAAPEAVALFARVRDSLDVDLHLLGADRRAVLDGLPIGELPLVHSISLGRHTLQVTTPDGRADERVTVVAHAGESLILRFGSPPEATRTTPLAPPGAPTGVAPPLSSGAPLAPSAGAALPSASLGSSLPRTTGPVETSLFGQFGLDIDPSGRAAVVEAGAGGGVGPAYGSVSGLAGGLGGIVARVGGQTLQSLAPLRLFAAGELPVFFTHGSPVGIGAQAGIGLHLWRLEPYLDLAAQHFFVDSTSSYSPNYVLMGVGVRAYILQ